ncbi:MAG: hypothetical protein ACYS0C_09905 [Planctomycetota bacterium]|jgi:hypothetical protein
MSPAAQIKRWAHQIHVAHLHPILWVEKHFTTRSFIIMAVVAFVVALYALLVIWAYLYGPEPTERTIEPFFYYRP